MQDYNILVTFHHNEKARAEEEVAKRINDSGLVLEDLMESSVPGLLLVRVAGDGKEAVKRLRGFAFRFPEMFRYTYHWTPVEEWVSSDIPAMIGAAREFGSRIGKGRTWKMELEKRRYHQEGSVLDLIKTLTDPIDAGTVDLESPDLVLKVEIIGDFAGFALVSDDEVLEVNQIRQTIGLAKIT
ncbi:THUMP domain-containing protein [Methanomassiliicoccus luminyensis]|jgi:tRNA acetyltransferase TAN1|uniref:THUMP domain-containing protein n=1 Tax=Methanomassiliicoccus luminyensis TaxID=1080712 RepID=UPI00036FC88E|nr:THUMP domain-containing protein [Methanomassiliicoccus luminyensis]